MVKMAKLMFKFYVLFKFYVMCCFAPVKIRMEKRNLKVFLLIENSALTSTLTQKSTFLTYIG